jgi:hypothetical protein
MNSQVSAGNICLIVALVLFAISAWSVSWGAPGSPQGYWHGRFIAAGLFFGTLSLLLK